MQSSSSCSQQSKRIELDIYVGEMQLVKPMPQYSSEKSEWSACNSISVTNSSIIKPSFMFSSFTNSVACKLSWEPEVLCQTLVNCWLFKAGGSHGSQLIIPKKKDGVKETGRKRN